MRLIQHSEPKIISMKELLIRKSQLLDEKYYWEYFESGNSIMICKLYEVVSWNGKYIDLVKCIFTYEWLDKKIPPVVHSYKELEPSNLTLFLTDKNIRVRKCGEIYTKIFNELTKKH